MPENVVIDFISDTSKLQPVVPVLDQIIERGSEMEAAFNKGTSAMNRQIDSSKVGKITLDQMSKSIRDLNKDVLEGGQVQHFKKFTDELTKSEQEIKSLTAQVKKLQEQVDKLSNPIEKTTVKTGTLVTQLRALKQQLAAMEQSGQIGTKAFTDLAIKAAKLEDQIGDTAQRIRVLASDTKNLDAALSLASGLAGGFAVAQGAAALFGDENKEIQKTLLKVQASLAILNGLQAIQATLNKDSAASVVILSAAQKAYNFVVGASTGAMKAFRIAMAATGIGLLVVGIIALVENFGKLKQVLGLGVNPALEESARKKQKLVDLSRDLAEGTSLEERRLTALGTKDSEVLKIRLGNIIKYIAALQEQFGVEQAILNEQLKAFGKQAGIIQALNQSGIIGQAGASILGLLGFGSVDEVADQSAKLKDITSTIEEAKVRIIETQNELNAAIKKRKPLAQYNRGY